MKIVLMKIAGNFVLNKYYHIIRKKGLQLFA